MLRAVDLAPVLGRSVVVSSGAPAPQGWENSPRFAITTALLADRKNLEVTVDRLHRAWVARAPVVVDLDVDPAVLREPETSTMDPWRLRRGFLFSRERLHHLVWANSYDGRNGELIWWWGRQAQA